MFLRYTMYISSREPFRNNAWILGILTGIFWLESQTLLSGDSIRRHLMRGGWIHRLSMSVLFATTKTMKFKIFIILIPHLRFFLTGSMMNFQARGLLSDTSVRIFMMDRFFPFCWVGEYYCILKQTHNLPQLHNLSTLCKWTVHLLCWLVAVSIERNKCAWFAEPVATVRHMTYPPLHLILGTLWIPNMERTETKISRTAMFEVCAGTEI